MINAVMCLKPMIKITQLKIIITHSFLSGFKFMRYFSSVK